jgi:hypothetical protein
MSVLARAVRMATAMRRGGAGQGWVIAIDGTKVAANASRDADRDYE